MGMSRLFKLVIFKILRSIIEPEVQRMIIKEARRIADELIIVTQVNMNQQLKEVGFEVLEQCTAVKGKFTRYITMCR